MSQALTPALQALRRTTLRKRRELPVRGELLVTIGDRVTSDSIVARAMLPGELRIFRIAETLGLTPDEVVKALKVQIGEQVAKGQLVCEYSGLFGLLKSRFHSPVSGVVEVISERTGHLGVRLPAVPLQLNAYIEGTIVSVEEGAAVTIESVASFIQGIFGIGGERSGKVFVLKIAPDQKIEPKDIPADCRGLLLVGGMMPTIEALKLAAERGAHGLLCGSIDDSALHEYLGYDLGIALTGDEEIPMSVIVTEGFGEIPLSRNLHDLLNSLDGRNGSMNGATQVRAGALRPELIVTPAAGTGTNSETSLRGLGVGSAVRIIRVPHFGKLGTVSELPTQLVEIETGALTRVVRVALSDGGEAVVPRANVELLARDAD